jgi:hypothetical protein
MDVGPAGEPGECDGNDGCGGFNLNSGVG